MPALPRLYTGGGNIAIQQPQSSLSSLFAGGGNSGLSELMQLANFAQRQEVNALRAQYQADRMQMQNAMNAARMANYALQRQAQENKLIYGSTDKEREATRQRMNHDRMLSELQDNQDFLKALREAMDTDRSFAGRLKSLRSLQAQFIDPAAKRYGLRGSDIFKEVFGKDEAYLKSEADRVQGQALESIPTRLGLGARRLYHEVMNVLLPGTNEREHAQAIIDAEKEAEANNEYIREQRRRAREGEGLTSRVSGLSGWLSELSESVPEIASFFLPGGVIGKGAQLLGRTAAQAARAGRVANIAGGAGLGGSMASIGYTQRVLEDPNIPPEQKQAIIEAPERQYVRALGSALGALAPDVATPGRFIASRLSPAYRAAATPEALTAAQGTRGTLNAAIRGGLNVGTGMGVMGAGQTVSTNWLYNSATGQNNPIFQGAGDAFISGAVTGGLLGAGGAAIRQPRVRRAYEQAQAQQAAAQQAQAEAQAQAQAQLAAIEQAHAEAQARADALAAEARESESARLRAKRHGAALRNMEAQQNAAAAYNETLERMYRADRNAAANAQYIALNNAGERIYNDTFSPFYWTGDPNWTPPETFSDMFRPFYWGSDLPQEQTSAYTVPLPEPTTQLYRDVYNNAIRFDKAAHRRFAEYFYPSTDVRNGSESPFDNFYSDLYNTVYNYTGERDPNLYTPSILGDFDHYYGITRVEDTNPTPVGNPDLRAPSSPGAFDYYFGVPRVEDTNLTPAGNPDLRAPHYNRIIDSTLDAYDSVSSADRQVLNKALLKALNKKSVWTGDVKENIRSIFNDYLNINKGNYADLARFVLDKGNKVSNGKHIKDLADVLTQDFGHMADNLDAVKQSLNLKYPGLGYGTEEGVPTNVQKGTTGTNPASAATDSRVATFTFPVNQPTDAGSDAQATNDSGTITGGRPSGATPQVIGANESNPTDSGTTRPEATGQPTGYLREPAIGDQTPDASTGDPTAQSIGEPSNEQISTNVSPTANIVEQIQKSKVINAEQLSSLTPEDIGTLLRNDPNYYTNNPNARYNRDLKQLLTNAANKAFGVKQKKDLGMTLSDANKLAIEDVQILNGLSDKEAIKFYVDSLFPKRNQKRTDIVC